MVTQANLDKQLKSLNIKTSFWGRSEIRELPNVLTENEIISQLVHGFYENGFAMLVATDHRMLLIDRKPFNFLNVEDFRFDMINQLDYKHRLFHSSIDVSAGPKNLKFTSYNQTGLRELLNSVQCRMIEIKEEKKTSAELQHNKLDQLDQTLKSYIRMQLRQSGPASYNGAMTGEAGLDTGAPGTDKAKMSQPGAAFEDYLQRMKQPPASEQFIKTGSILPRPKADLMAAKIAFAKLPWLISRRRH